MSEIKPIETLYKGYRFRSRLEARWAVFFDALKLKWYYEMEGYVLPSGEYYLPDFYFPENGFHPEGWHRPNCYVEIKPPMVEGDKPEEHFKKSYEFFRATGDEFNEGANILLLDGPPQYEISMGINLADCKIKRYFYLDCEGIWKQTLGDYFGWDKLDEAIELSRSARFEFGEKGTK